MRYIMIAIVCLALYGCEEPKEASYTNLGKVAGYGLRVVCDEANHNLVYMFSHGIAVVPNGC